MLPHDLPPWKIVHHYYRTWRDDGSLDEVQDALDGHPSRTNGNDDRYPAHTPLEAPLTARGE